MKMLGSKSIVSIMLFFCALLISSCSIFSNDPSNPSSSMGEKEKLYSRFDFALDTAIKIDIYEGGSERILDRALDILKDFELQMSFYSEEGELNRINELLPGRELELSDMMFEVLKIAQDVYRISGGKFDVSIGAITELWRESASLKKLPDPEKIKELMKYKGFDHIILMNNRIIKHNPQTKFDLGGIGKGFAGDLVKRHLVESGVSRAIINFGGNLILMGSEPEKPFKIGIQDPFGDKNNYFAVLSVGDCAVVTSGNYERYYEVDGKSYHHIIDAETGYPVDNTLTSVTVITDSSAYADALSTAFFSMGLTEGLKVANSLEDVDAYFVSKNKKVYSSKYSDDGIIITDKRYKLIKWNEMR